MDHFMLGCPALEMEWRLKVVRVSLISYTKSLILFLFILMFFNSSFQLKEHGQAGVHGILALQHVAKERDHEQEASLEGFHVQAMQQIQKYVNVS